MPSRRKHIKRKSLRRTKSRRGGVPHTRSGVPYTRSGVSNVGRPISSAINKTLERLERLETELKKTLKEEKEKWNEIVDDYQKNGADGEHLADPPKSLHRAYEQLYEVQKQIERLKPKKKYDVPITITSDQRALGSE